MPIHASLSLARCAVLRADTKEWKGGGEERQNSGARLSNRERRMGEGYGEGRKRGRVVGGNRQDRGDGDERKREKRKREQKFRSVAWHHKNISVFRCASTISRGTTGASDEVARLFAVFTSSLTPPVFPPSHSIRVPRLSFCVYLRRRTKWGNAHNCQKTIGWTTRRRAARMEMLTFER